MAAKSRLQKKQNNTLRYTANLLGMGAGVYIAVTAVLQFLFLQVFKSFHQSATLANPVSVPQGVVIFANIIFAFTALLCACLFVYKLAPPALKPEITLEPPKNARLWAFLPVFIAVGFLINAMSDFIQKLLAANTQYVAASQPSLPTGFFQTFFAIIYMCVLPAVFEEFFCRGIMQGMLRRWGVWFSIVVSSVLFTLLHSDIAQMPGIFMFSVMLGLAYYATGSLSACIALHFANNFVVFIFMSVEQKLSGAAMVGFSFYIMLLVLLCAAVCVGYIIQKRLIKTLKPIPRVYDPKNRQSRTVTLAASPFFMLIMLMLAARAFWPLFVRV